MKAAYLVAPRAYELREIPEPLAPRGGLVLQVVYCGICGSDIRRWREGPLPVDVPVLAGHEVGGIVFAADRDAPFQEGERLALAPDVHCGRCYYCQRGYYNLCDSLAIIGITPGWPGGFAEKMALGPEILHNGIVHPIPEGVSFMEGALAEPLSSVVGLHQELATGPADTVVVIGAGPIGCLHTAIAKARGARVIVSQRSALRRALVQRFHPDAIIDPNEEDLVHRVYSLTGGRGADIAICANPVAETQRQAIELVRKRGRVVLFGGLPKADPLTTLDGNLIHYRELQVLGSFSYHPTMHALALEILARKLIDARALVTHVFPLESIANAFEEAASGRSLKVMVQPTPEEAVSDERP